MSANVILPRADVALSKKGLRTCTIKPIGGTFLYKDMAITARDARTASTSDVAEELVRPI